MLNRSPRITRASRNAGSPFPQPGARRPPWALAVFTVDCSVHGPWVDAGKGDVEGRSDPGRGGLREELLPCMPRQHQTLGGRTVLAGTCWSLFSVSLSSLAPMCSMCHHHLHVLPPKADSISNTINHSLDALQGRQLSLPHIPRLVAPPHPPHQISGVSAGACSLLWAQVELLDFQASPSSRAPIRWTPQACAVKRTWPTVRTF